MSSSCETVSLEFGCSPEKVWSVFTDAERYGEWYGYPRCYEVVAVEPSFSAGGKLSFKGIRGTSVVTACEPYSHIAISSSVETNDFTISPTAEGCRVSLFTTLNGETDWSGTAAARSRANREILHRLRRAAKLEGEDEPEREVFAERAQVSESVPLLKSVFSGLFHAYKNPLKRRRGAAEDSIALANIIDNTEADVAVHFNAAVACGLMCVLLFFSLFTSVRFPLADIVPSSGLSVYHSEGVNKKNACKLFIGQTKAELELLLSCAGTRLSPNQFVYYSDEAESSSALSERIYAIYDAYGCVRSFAYIDGAMAERQLNMQVRDLVPKLFGVKSVESAEKAVGYELSSFWVDRDGSSVVRFGVLDSSRGVFDALPTSQLEVRLDAPTGSASAAYYSAHDTGLPLPASVYGPRLSRQYNNNSYYVADRLACERSSLLLNLTGEQADIVLGEGVDYARSASGETLRSYGVRSLASDEAQFRYRYDIWLSPSGTVVRASFRNRSLALHKGVLLDEEEYSFKEGMSLYEALLQLQILPSWLMADSESIVLGFGEQVQGEYEDRELLCRLNLIFDTETRELLSYEFN